MNRTRFFNIDVERELLGILIKDNDKICEVIDILTQDDFYRDNHKIIYKTIYDMYTHNEPIDITTLVEALGKRLSTIGGITYLSELIACPVSSTSIKKYAEIIKEKSILRNLGMILQTAIKKTEDEEIKTDDIIAEINNQTLKLNNVISKDTGSVEEGLNNLIDTLQKRYENGGAIQGIPTSWSAVDRTINGLNKQDFIIIAARPSMGKSAFANNIATNVTLRKGAIVNFFSLEMSKEQLLERMLSSISNIELDKYKKGKLNEKEWAEIARAAAILNNPKLKIYDEILTLNGIRAECKKRKLQEGLDVVIIDYLQLIEGNRTENRQQEVSDISRQLKLMAMELKCTVIALSQLSRACEQRGDKRPLLSDLRESGAIEQDADIIMFLYRDEYYNENTKDKDVLETIISKNRNGEVGTIKLLWMPHYQKIGERTNMVYEGKYDPKVFNGRG